MGKRMLRFRVKVLAKMRCIYGSVFYLITAKKLGKLVRTWNSTLSRNTAAIYKEAIDPIFLASLVRFLSPSITKAAKTFFIPLRHTKEVCAAITADQSHLTFTLSHTNNIGKALLFHITASLAFQAIYLFFNASIAMGNGSAQKHALQNVCFGCCWGICSVPLIPFIFLRIKHTNQNLARARCCRYWKWIASGICSLEMPPVAKLWQKDWKTRSDGRRRQCLLWLWKATCLLVVYEQWHHFPKHVMSSLIGNVWLSQNNDL